MSNSEIRLGSVIEVSPCVILGLDKSLIRLAVAGPVSSGVFAIQVVLLCSVFVNSSTAPSSGFAFRVWSRAAIVIIEASEVTPPFFVCRGLKALFTELFVTGEAIVSGSTVINSIISLL